MADEQRNRGAPGRHGLAQLIDGLVLDPAVDQLGVQGTAAGAGGTDDEPTQRTGEQGADQQAPRPGSKGTPAGREIGGLSDVRGAVGVTPDEDGVMELQILIFLQAYRGQHEFLRLERIIKGNDKQLAAFGCGHASILRPRPGLRDRSDSGSRDERSNPFADTA